LTIALNADRLAPTRRSLPPGLWTLPPLAVLGLLFFYPLALIGAQALRSGQEALSLRNFVSVTQTPLFQNALLHTLEIALVASALCLLLGFAIALLLFFAPFPGSREVARLIDSFIALPTFLMTLAFTFIYGSAGILNGALMTLFDLPLPPIDFLYSLWGVILAEVTVFTPFVLRPLLAAFSQLDPAQIEVASSLGAKPWRIIREVIFPAALPALAAGGSLCLLLTVNEFGIVLFIGAKGVVTLPLLVYGKAIQEGDYTSACTIAIINIALSLILYGLYRIVVARLGGRDAAVV
jgi:2-aminoethylphosphonate transport system permease protein